MEEEKNNPQNDNNENKENNEINRETTTTGVVQEVPSKKFIFGKKVITLTKKKDINAVVGEELSNGEIKERLITAIKENGERQKEKEDEKEKETGEKTKKSFKAKYIVPIIILLMIPIMLLRGCDGMKDNVPKEQIVTVPVKIELHNTDNPYKSLEGIINSSGQESMTANAIEGEGLEGEHYSSLEQFEAEYRASSGVEHFEEMKAEIDSKIEVLTSEDSSKEEKADAARRLLELEQEATESYTNNEDFAKQYVEKFKGASEAYRDSNTDSEKVAVDLMLEEYLSELGLSSYNVAQVEEIVRLVDEGYEIDLEAEKEMDGDYEITGEAVKKIVQEQDLNKSKSIWQKFADFVKGRDDKGLEK